MSSWKLEYNNTENDGFFRGLRNHDETYYVAGVIAFASMVGVPFSCFMIWKAVDDFRRDGTRCIYTNNTWCIFCLCPCPGPHVAAFALAGVVFFATVGFAALAGILAAALQFLARDFAAQYEREAIMREFIAQDLSSPEERIASNDSNYDDAKNSVEASDKKIGKEPLPPPPVGKVEQAEQERLHRDLRNEFSQVSRRRLPDEDTSVGSDNSSDRRLVSRGYGSMESA